VLISITEFIGHFHPVLVHLPIGILLLACLFQFLAGKEKYSSLHTAINIAFLVGMISAVIACITGYLLSRSGDYDEELADKHQWFGISVAVMSIVMYYLNRRSVSNTLKIFTSIFLFILIMITGHLGGSLTYGTDYLTASLNKTDDTSGKRYRKPLPDVQGALVYSDIIQPVLENKCYSCHGKSKQRGKLRMDLPERLMKGGKDGVVIVANQAEKSEMIKRLMLPREDPDHMPPKQKSQLEEKEIALIHWWISTGASFDKKVKELEQPEKIKPALAALEHPEQEKKVIPDIPAAKVEKADEAAIQKLKDIGVVIMPVAQNTNYLMANFITASKHTDKEMELLLPLKKQLIWLKLGSTSITDSALKIISQCTRLMRLQLEYTGITDKGLIQLRSFHNLQYLNLVGTSVTAAGILQLKELKELKSIYLYKTEVAKSDWDILKKAFPKTLIDSGGYSVPILVSDTTEVKQTKPGK
jgi:uncharacterized membrane protein/mono/diheme cytochrome c family protein